MASVGKPRFYVNVLEWLHTKGDITTYTRFMTLPVLSDVSVNTTIHGVGNVLSQGKNFHAVLNYTSNSAFGITGADTTDIVNFGGEYSGFRIATFTNTLYTIEMDTAGGSLIVGTYYDMPNPDLSLTMSREYGGTKETTTYNGSYVSNTMWSKPAKWGNYEAWSLGTLYSGGSGRRSWNLKFSYIDHDDLWGTDQSSATNDSFFSQVWHKTLGGTLPFIFQPDGDGDTPDSGNNDPDQFAICKFKENSMQATQSAHNVYDISLSIEEVW